MDQQQVKQQYQLLILGIAQDAGYPQVNCYRDCCKNAWEDLSLRRFATSLAIIDTPNKKWWLIDVSPDIKEQMHLLHKSTDHVLNPLPEAVFLTHGHIGHYIGLTQFGKEIIDAGKLPVYAMPKMRSFLESNLPFSQMIKNENLKIIGLNNSEIINIANRLFIKPVLVPHRDEYTETVAYELNGPVKNILFIPDIDSWEEWKINILSEIKKVDMAFLDGSFYDKNELTGKDMNDIPHPSITKSMELFRSLDYENKNKIHFIHFNHTNPVIRNSPQKEIVISNGFNISVQGKSYSL